MYSNPRTHINLNMTEGMPLPPGAIICPIQIRRRRKGDTPMKAPQWFYDEKYAPTPQLSQKGLTVELLIQEVKDCNAKSSQIWNSNFHNRCNYLWIPFALIIIGFIVMIGVTAIFGEFWTFWLGIAIIGAGAIFGIIMCGYIGDVQGKEYKNTKNAIKEQMELYLNSKWNGNGIKWTVLTMSYRGRDGCCDSATNKIAIHHLVFYIPICIANY